MVVPSASVADAVISAEAPLATLSARVLASESVSLEEPTLNSSASVTVTCIVWSAVLPPASVALTTTTHGFDAHVIDS